MHGAILRLPFTLKESKSKLKISLIFHTVHRLMASHIYVKSNRFIATNYRQKQL
jgi:hypothetical protein